MFLKCNIALIWFNILCNNFMNFLFIILKFN